MIGALDEIIRYCEQQSRLLAKATQTCNSDATDYIKGQANAYSRCGAFVTMTKSNYEIKKAKGK